MTSASGGSRRGSGASADPALDRDGQADLSGDGGADFFDADRGRTDRTAEPAPRTTRAKTSAAATFALVFGLSALFCALTGILSPPAIVFGIVGLILGIVGLRMARKPGVTGKGVAIGGLVTAVLGLVVGGVVIGGATALVNNQQQLDRLQGYIDDARSNLPATDQVRQNLPGQ
jgi:hypothetical protein